MKGKTGIEFLEVLRVEFPDIRVIVMTAYSDLDSTVAAYRGGAFEYLSKPFDLDEATALVKRALMSHSERQTSEVFEKKVGLIGSAPAMQEVYRLIGRLAKSTMNVLITGESGTGKEVVARAIHNTSPRAANILVAINTAAIPVELLETELFGHEKGAFTGAEAQRIGRFEQAEGGTLFLDEIGDMPLALQTRLLRVLSDGSFYRVGGHHQQVANVRVIAATNQNLSDQVKGYKGRMMGIAHTEGQVWTELRRFTLKHLRNFGFGKQKSDGIIQDEANYAIGKLIEDRVDSSRVNISNVSLFML